MDIDKKIAMVENNTLGLDDEFDFDCQACGDCCHNRTDLLVTPYDIFRIAKHLQMSTKAVIEKYCEVYIGDDSKLPVVRIKPQIHNLVCPFLKKGLCGIQNAKPLICGIYPLGRAFTKDFTPVYFIQPVRCGKRGVKHKVRDWLQAFDLLNAENSGSMWSELLFFLVTFIHKQKVKDEKQFEPLWRLLSTFMYLNYDIKDDFDSQFKMNCDIIKWVVNENGLNVERFFEKTKYENF